jgi:hypothetical protein
MGPKRAGLRFGDEQRPRKSGVLRAQRGGEQNRLVLQPTGLTDGDDVEDLPHAACP